MSIVLSQTTDHTARFQYTPSEVKIGGTPSYLFVKRLLDLLISVFGLILLAIPIIIISIIIKCDSPGPVIFKQERLGKDGKPFTIYKFRSMGLDAEINGPQWAEANDIRCTKIGTFLRKTRIDELPQLYNIIRGDMTLVGPRPERECFYIEFEKYIPGFQNRMVVTPGLTGHAQVNGGYKLLPEEKIIYDMEYIQNRSLRMDLQCIFKTLNVVLTRNGAQ